MRKTKPDKQKPTPPFWYFTCGQTHSHPLPDGKVWNKNSVIRIQRATSTEADEYVKARFGQKWAMCYTEKAYRQSAHLYPGGIVLTVALGETFTETTSRL
jgi:hypothetical protein